MCPVVSCCYFDILHGVCVWVCAQVKTKHKAQAGNRAHTHNSTEQQRAALGRSLTSLIHSRAWL